MHLDLTHNPKKVYLFVVFVWLFLTATVMSGIIAFDIENARNEFGRHAEEHWQQANDRARINETILEGFAAMIGSGHDLDWPRIHSYARKMLAQYPYIYMFEIIEQIGHGQLDAFVDYYRRARYPDFEVKGFRYESDRQWQPVGDADQHLPIVFMEPFPPESRKVLGLDVSNNEFLMRALQKSERMGHPVATDPFKLVEGQLAYLVARPIASPDSGDPAYHSPSGASNGWAALVILADTLLDRHSHMLPGMVELLYNPAFDPDDPRGWLHRGGTPMEGRLVSALFPRLDLSRALDSESQPFILHVEQQLGWNVISWGKLGLTLLVGMITFAIMVVYARLYFRNEMERAEMTVRLFHLANHDALTGLANRNLLEDRLNHAIAQARRNNARLAVLFLDLEEFKTVNDSHGHETGDSILRRAAERLRACVRAGDTIARLGGDEFLLVLENIHSESDVTHVVDKIKAGFEQPFTVGSVTLTVGISIGVAIYPQDGSDGETLVKHADEAMYSDKRARD